MVWKKQQLVEAFRKEKLEQLIGCVCVCVVVDDVRPSAAGG